MKSLLIVAGVIVALIGGAALLGRSSGEQSSLNSSQGAVEDSIHELTISGFSYQPGSIDVDLGDTVTLKITNRDRVTHGINLPIFGVQKFVRPGQTQTVTFIADQKGDPELFCSSDHGEKLLVNVL